MRETRFIEQNKQKWAKFEQVLSYNQNDPEELSNLFIDITDDLSYSRTFYPNRSVRVYLNNIAQKVFYSVYKNRQSRLKRFWSFWVNDVPQVIYESRREFYFALLFFLAAVGVGVFSTYMDPNFPEVMLSRGYVERTYESIENGTPMSVYQQEDELDMFLGIVYNNLRVALTTFILGLFFGLGTIYTLLFNGVMVGAFQSLFIVEGVYWDSILTIWVHGTIEIASIIVAGAAGLTLGKSLVFPGTYTRLQSLQLAARRGLLIMLTVFPLLVIAAFIEGFITRYTDAPYALRATIILASLAFVILYYVIYPYIRSKRSKTSFIREVELPPSQSKEINYGIIKDVGQFFSDTFSFYGKNIRTILGLSTLFTIAYILVIYFIIGGVDMFNSATQTNYNPFEIAYKTFGNLEQIIFLSLDDSTEFVLFLCNYVIACITTFTVMHKITQDAHKNKVNPESMFGTSYYIKTITAVAGIMLLVQLIFTAEPIFILLLGLFIVPLLLLWLSCVFNEQKNLLAAFPRIFSVLKGNWFSLMAGYVVIALMCNLFFLTTTAPVLLIYKDLFVTLFLVSNDPIINTIFFIGIYMILLCLLLPLIPSLVSMAFYSFRETVEANDLHEQISTIGNTKKSYGMVRESN
ncbi:MAG: stage II sporulation protein M [Saprospiraceae bacterium]|nr:stage II sporulation protein M [Saprospiraceae bacterium]